MSLAQAIQNMMVLALPAAIYAGVVAWRARIGFAEIRSRLGVVIGKPRPYLIATIASVPAALIGISAVEQSSRFKGSMIAPFVDQPPTAQMFMAVFAYGVVATGFPEELLFRGLIGGVFFRRFSFWAANVFQALIFMLPHLLILFVAPTLWPFAICFPMGLGLLNGWLRHSSGSIGPAVILHAVPNMAGALAVMRWAS